MTALFRRPFGPQAMPTAAIVLLGAALGSTAVGCGSSEQEAASDRDTTTAQKAAPPAAGAGGEDRPSASPGSRDERGAEERPRRARSRSAGRPAAGGGASREVSRSPIPAATHGVRGAKERALCPPPLTRADCAARAKAQEGAQDTPSYPVSAPDDCLQAMSEAECREVFEAQKAAVEAGGGRSIDPETCLEEYGREFCEAQLGDQYAQQHAASQGAP